MEVKPGVLPSVTCHNIRETCLPTGVEPDSPCPAVGGAVSAPVLPTGFPDQAPLARVARQKISGEERSEYANTRRCALHPRASRDSSPQTSPASSGEVQETKRDAPRKCTESVRGQTPDEAGATPPFAARCVTGSRGVAPASSRRKRDRFWPRTEQERRTRKHGHRRSQVTKVRVVFCTPDFSIFRTFRALQVKHYKGDLFRERTNSSLRKITETGGSDPGDFGLSRPKLYSGSLPPPSFAAGTATTEVGNEPTKFACAHK